MRAFEELRRVPGTTSRLRLPDNGSERGRRADPSKAMPAILTTDEDGRAGHHAQPRRRRQLRRGSISH